MCCTVGRDRSSFVDASAEHGDLASIIRKHVQPDAFAVHHKPPPQGAPARRHAGRNAAKPGLPEPLPEQADEEGDAEAEEEEEEDDEER